MRSPWRLRGGIASAASRLGRRADVPVFLISAEHGTGGDLVGYERGVVVGFLDSPLLGKE